MAFDRRRCPGLMSEHARPLPQPRSLGHRWLAGFGQFDLAMFPKPAAKWYRQNWLRHPNASDTTARAHVIQQKLHTRISQELESIATGAIQTLTLSVE
eukprot:COSAG01_NODE_4773_length_4753_cov_3.688440_6_plen_98_part_00